jgi:hypothetical protein
MPIRRTRFESRHREAKDQAEVREVLANGRSLGSAEHQDEA